jgi:hypothetical protein
MISIPEKALGYADFSKTDGLIKTYYDSGISEPEGEICQLTVCG